jgi:thiol-disulfide isomerase/thioredoxin
MKITQTIFILLAVIAMSACNSKKEDSLLRRGKVIIEGNIELTDDHSKVVTLYAPNSIETIRKTEIIDSTGTFRFEFETFHSHDAFIKYKNIRVDLYVTPSDSLFLKLNSEALKNNSYPFFEISGSNAETSNNIIEYWRFRRLASFVSDVENKSVEEYLSDLAQYISLEDSVLSAFIEKYNPTDDFKTWAKNYIIYSKASKLLSFNTHHDRNKTQFEGELFDKRLFPVNDDSAIVTSLYGTHLWHYSSFRYMGDDTLVMNLLRKEKRFQAYNTYLKNIIKHEEPGISRDIMCYKLFKMLHKHSLDVFNALRKDVSLFIDNKELIAMVQEKKKVVETKRVSNISQLSLESKEECEIMGGFWERIKNKHKGKVIYLDFWATWCGPCRGEIPHAIELHDYYKDKPIGFVNICMSSDSIMWKKIVEDSHIAGENHFLNNDQTKIVRSKFKIPGFPTYMILDKEGNIVNYDAPRPSTDSIIKGKLDDWILKDI